MTGTIDLAEDGRSLLIRFPYREDLVEEVRLIPGRQWDRDSRVWTVPVVQLELVVDTFEPHGFQLAPEVSGMLPDRDGRAADTSGGEPTLPFGAPAAPQPAPEPAALTISLLNERVRRALRGGFPDPLWVVGEVLDFDRAANRRHVFFSLVEKRPDQDQPAARVEVALFEGARERILPVLRDAEHGLTLRDGIEVRVLVRVDLYPATGRYQLILEDIDPAFTLGKLALTREAILADLRQRGIDRRNAELPLPDPPLRIGVLTSPDSDGWADFRKHLESSGLGFSVTCYAVRVQGEALRPTMLAGLRWFAQRHADHDVLCVLRGGGSRTDLAWFDDREVALAVALHPLPVLCGIGHERDRSVLDAIARSAKTPTAVAQFLVDRVRAVGEQLEDAARALVAGAREALSAERRRIEQRADRLGRELQARLATERQALSEAARRARRGAVAVLAGHRERATRWTSDLRREALRALERARERLAARAARQRLLDPRRVLERGYALVRDAEGRVHGGARELRPGMELDIAFRDGHARATTTSVRQDEVEG